MRFVYVLISCCFRLLIQQAQGIFDRALQGNDVAQLQCFGRSKQAIDC